ncbi:hypothetical protein M0Q50_10275 [bacterium]|jgi:hypothetical protein|nr:hypothetical protein [bacterium]
MENGYHNRKITKGTYGEISKLQEELEEYLDAQEQGIIIMELLELSDIYGALEAVLIKYNISMEDLKKMSDVTKRAFKNGKR